MYSIDLDCPPGGLRPDALIAGVLLDTELTEQDFEQTTRFFGNWTWVLKPGKEAAYRKARDTVQAHITALYNAGIIRYGSW